MTNAYMPTRLDLKHLGHALTGAIAAILAPLSIGHAQEAASTPAVFRRFSAAVVKVEVIELASAAKASVGSGFFVGPEGDVLTNYHVIAELVHDPDRYRADVIDASGGTHSGRLVALDVVHDLALVATDEPRELYLRLSDEAIERGLRLYALGHPADLGLSIIEGTYNGLLEHTLYDRIHFTGSLNPGMSGGPAITEAGDVVGINVATAGDQLSFLVPAARAISLLERRRSLEPEDSVDFTALIGEQLREHQSRYFDRILADSLPTVEIEGYRVPTKPAEFFNCWGDVISSREDPFVERTHECSTDDYIYLSPEHSSGTFEMEHTVLTSDELNPFQFFALYSNRLQGTYEYLSGRESDVTPFRCNTRNVALESLKLRASFCARAYRKYEDLYDVVFRAAALGGRGRGLVSMVTMSGVGFENAQRLAKLYLESISWKM